MPVQSLEDLQAALDNQAFDRLLGTRESTWVDFKSQPYQLGSDRGGWELAKDVAALANATGGAIVIGVRTVKAAGTNLDVANELRPVPPSLLNLERHRHVVTAGIFPVPEGINLAEVAMEGGSLLVISVPSQPEQARPFLLRYLIDQSDRKMAGFAWPIRSGDGVIWQSCEQFQGLLNLERSVRRLFEAGARTSPTSTGVPMDSIRNRALALREQIDSSAPALILQVAPCQPVDLTSVMYGDRGVAGVVRRRRPLRNDGFHLRPGANTDVRGPLGVEYGARWRTAIDFSGLVTCLIPAGPDGLTWAMDQRGDKNAINPIVLTEVMNDFFRLLYDVVLPAGGLSHELWTAHVRGVDLLAGGIKLSQGFPRSVHDNEVAPASTNDFERTFVLSGKPDTDTYTALTIFYALFGWAADDNPFVDQGTFSATEFLASTKR